MSDFVNVPTSTPVEAHVHALVDRIANLSDPDVELDSAIGVLERRQAVTSFGCGNNHFGPVSSIA